MKRFTAVRPFVFALILSAGLGPATAAGNPAVGGGGPRVRVDLSVWESSGGSTWSQDASATQPLFGDPTSKLEYEKVDSTVVELRARVELPDEFAAELAYGAGDAEDGSLTDSDFLSARGAERFNTTVSGAHAYSQTTSSLNGDAVRYFDVKLTRKLYRSVDGKGAAGLAARYLDWTEQYRARGVTQTVCTAPGRLCLPSGATAFPGLDVIYNDARWQALFIGAWGTRRLDERLTLSGELSLSPLAFLTSDDRHFLRSDLAQDPSFRLEGNGRAAAAQLDARYRFTPRLSASLGVRYWWMEVRDEARGFIVFPAGGEPFSTRLNGFETERYGVVLSLAYTLN